jgi:hypothetical protein
MRIVIKEYLIITTIILMVACCKNDDEQTPEAPKPSIKVFPSCRHHRCYCHHLCSNFDPNKDNNELKFNGVSATVLTASADSFTARVPAGALTGSGIRATTA